ncbi:MAG: S8 family serine peptidase [Verrucomicrobia bacterium]|nr:S8 family serine peptidase [Verrucomicrobiota bacterium]
MNLIASRLARVLSAAFAIATAFLSSSLSAAPAPGRAAAEAARALVASGTVTHAVGGQPRVLVLAADEVAVPRRDAGLEGLPAGAQAIAADAQHAIHRLPAGVAVADAVAAEVRVAAALSLPGATPLERAALRPVFYERGRAGDERARHIATADLLLLGVERMAAQAAAAATGAEGVVAQITDVMPVLRYASAWEMLAAAESLRAAGLGVSPQFTHALAKRAAPNDPLYNQQFYFKNTGQGGGTAGEDLNIESLWPAANGAGVTVAVVDDGLEITHPDFAGNVPADTSLHRNVLDENSDPTPPAAANHGTICAGFIAARGNNGIGMTGAAPQARLVGVRLLGEGKNGASATDVQEAAAFGWKTDVVQISSNSWGPNDDGATVSAPEPGALAALRAAVTTGRGGRGVVFFVATGNGRDSGDHAGFDGYSGSRYVIAIGATDNRGRQAPFSESGPQVLACAAGQTSEGADAQLLATDNVGARGANTAASPAGDYTTDGVQGTSYSTPQVAGVAALMLQANPALGWRDVKEILIRTARKNHATDADWVNNSAGFHFNHKYGAGFVDAAAAVTLARTWANLGAELTATQSSTTSSAIPDNDPAGASRALVVASATAIRVETVEVAVSVTHANRGQLRFEVTSPAGTRTVLGEAREKDTAANLTSWVFSTPRHWGETANGTWTVRVIDSVAGTSGTLTSASVTLYGASQSSAVTAPTITAQPAAVAASAGGSVTFSVTATGSNLTYQWRKDGANITGATGATLTLNNVSAADAASYTVVVGNGAVSTTSSAAALTLTPVVAANPGRLVNLSLLTALTSADDSFTMGTFIGGANTTGTKPLLVRAAGPALGALGVGDTLQDPKLEFFSAGGTKVAENDDWGGGAALANAFAAVGAFPYAAATSKDAAVFNPAIAIGGYSIKVSGNGTTGTVIAELYDSTANNAFTATTPRLVNVSVLKQIGSGFTVGFVIGGGTSRTVLVRAVGPGLAGVGVASGFVADPTLTLFRGSTRINANDDWGGGAALSAAFSGVGAFALPARSLDAALLATLTPDQYSVRVEGVEGAAGLVLVEVYEVP